MALRGTARREKADAELARCMKAKEGAVGRKPGCCLRHGCGGGFGMQAERTGRQVPFVAPKLAAGVGLVKVSAFVSSVCPPGLGAA